MDVEGNLNKLGIGGNSHYFREVANPKLEEIKKLLDDRHDKEKLEGMKRLIAAISKGRDVSALFPDVVKNVVCQSLELKKLVYIFIVHYAESQSETALLAINTFQKGLENKNQLIRALALRVMSSIRVRLISGLVVMAIKSAARDSSPYVRKTAAHAIPKVFSQDQDQKDVLTEVISDLLGDKQTLVLGSAMAAFNEVCPDRFDLLHPHYRKFCNLLADIDEWGQIIILNVLIRYGRTQFVDPDPNKDKAKKTKKPKKPGQFYSDSDSEKEEKSDNDSEEDLYADDYQMDPDQRLLLRCALPLLQSRNNGVVMAVATLYYYLAPAMEAQKVGKSLVRIIRSHREGAYVVLANIANMASKRPEMFAPYLSEFFVSSTDPGFCRDLKLEILTYIASESTIHRILRELHNYVHRDDKNFVTATVQAIARCALQIPEVMDTCMHGLITLMKSKNEAVVAESVIAIKKLLQTGTKEYDYVITHFAKQIDTTKVPEARASIVWVIGEYCHKIPKYAPDVLRKLAKSFTDEEGIVKVQILNLGVKLHLENPDQCTQLFQYILTISKYDTNYDIRDKARVMRQILFSDSTPYLKERAKTLFFCEKAIPQNRSPSDERSRWGLGSLSHVVKHSAFGYQPIPDFPEVAPDPSVRNVVVIAGKPTDARNFYSDEDSYSSYSDSRSSGSYSDEDGFYSKSDRSYSDDDSRSDRSYSDDDSRSYSSDESRSDSHSDSDDSFYSSDEDDRRKKSSKSKSSKAKKPPPKKEPKKAAKQPAKAKAAPPAKKSQPAAKSSEFDFLDFGPAPTESTSTDNAFDMSSLSPALPTNALSPADVQLPRYLLLNPVSAGGLSVEYSFLRKPSMYGEQYNTVQLWLRNSTTGTLSGIKIGKLMLEGGTDVKPFTDIPLISPGGSTETLMSIRFGSINQPAKFEVWHAGGHYVASIAPVAGELIRAASISPQDFTTTQKKLSGLNEADTSFTMKDVETKLPLIPQVVLQNAWVNVVTQNEEEGKFQFSGRTVLDNLTILVSVTLDPSSGKGRVKVNCENAIMGATLANILWKALLAKP